MNRLTITTTMLCALVGAVVSSAYGAGNTAAPAEQFVLSGVLVNGERGIAWLLEPTLTQNRVIAVRPGEFVGPYQLIAVLDDRVEMQGPAGMVLVPLYSAGSAGSPTAVSSAPPSTRAPDHPSDPNRSSSPKAVASTTPPPSSSLADILNQLNVPVSSPLQHLQPVPEPPRQASQIMPPRPSTSEPGAPTRRVYQKGDPRLRGALQSLLGGN